MAVLLDLAALLDRQRAPGAARHHQQRLALLVVDFEHVAGKAFELVEVQGQDVLAGVAQ
ncbi:hypothetical protein D9M71_277420 [compost metagenome]